MTLEEQLKQYIIEQYGSIRAFTIQKGLTYASVDSILRRGIKNATWTNVKKLCAALGITADGLAKNQIIRPEVLPAHEVKIEDLVFNFKQQLMNTDNLTINGQLATESDIVFFINTLDVALQLNKKQNQTVKEG